MTYIVLQLNLAKKQSLNVYLESFTSVIRKRRLLLEVFRNVLDEFSTVLIGTIIGEVNVFLQFPLLIPSISESPVV